jgi:hypothetical protein
MAEPLESESGGGLIMESDGIDVRIFPTEAALQ